jgi:hypothetical protein
MEDREIPRMQKYGESKTTQIMMATVCHVTSEAESTKFKAAWFLLDRVYMDFYKCDVGHSFCQLKLNFLILDVSWIKFINSYSGSQEVYFINSVA